MQPSTLTFPVAGHGGEAALRRAVAVLSTDGYTMQSTSDTESIGIKRVIPPWAIVMTIIFGLFCLVGLLFLLVKVEREVKASFVGGPDGGSIVVTGAMSGKVIDRLRAEFRSQGAVDAAPLPMSPAVSHSADTSVVDQPLVAAPVDVAPSSEPFTAEPELPVIGPPPGVPATTWSDPAEGAVVDTHDVADGADVVLSVPGAFDDVDGYTVARPRHVDPTPSPVVQMDDGQLLPIGGRVLLGRDPAAAPGESVDRLVSLTDDTRGLSKTHAGLAADGNLLWVTDRHSTNGTSIRSASGEERACPPGEGLQVEMGDTVRVGGRWLVRVQ